MIAQTTSLRCAQRVAPGERRLVRPPRPPRPAKGGTPTRRLHEVGAAQTPDPTTYPHSYLAPHRPHAEAHFVAALGEDSRSYPFLRARTLFSFGRWLRRQRRSADSRTPLRDAINLFDALGATRWSEHARQELRATGEKIGPRTPDARDRLTAQELQIAQLAAAGLSNREIGEWLFLSHRTIGSHLYRIFPKLGITARRNCARPSSRGAKKRSVD